MLIRRNYFYKNRFLSFLYAPLHYLYDVAYSNNKFYRSHALKFFASYFSTGGVGNLRPAKAFYPARDLFSPFHERYGVINRRSDSNLLAKEVSKAQLEAQSATSTIAEVAMRFRQKFKKIKLRILRCAFTVRKHCCAFDITLFVSTSA